MMRGIFPFYKDKGIYIKDVADWVSLCVGFDAGAAFNPAGVKIAVFPRLRFNVEGLVHVAVGPKAPLLLSNFKYGEHSAHVTGRLGHRSPDLVWEEEPQTNKDCNHVTSEMFKSTLQTFIGEKTQVPIPLELVDRSYITELIIHRQRRGPTVTSFYEGTQPRKIEIKSFSNVVFREEDKSFAFDIHFSKFICMHRFIDDIGIKLNTFATADRIISTKFYEMRAEQGLKGYELSLNEVRRAMSKNAETYNRIVEELNQNVRHINTKMKNPWQMISA